MNVKEILYKQTELDLMNFSFEEKKQLINNLTENLMFVNEKTQKMILGYIYQINVELYDEIVGKI